MTNRTIAKIAVITNNSALMKELSAALASGDFDFVCLPDIQEDIEAIEERKPD